LGLRPLEDFTANIPIWSASQQELQTGDLSTSNGINELFPVGIPAFVKSIENTNSLSAASSIDKCFPQFRKGLDELFPACPMLGKNGVCQKVGGLDQKADGGEYRGR